MTEKTFVSCIRESGVNYYEFDYKNHRWLGVSKYLDTNPLLKDEVYKYLCDLVDSLKK